MFRVDSQPEEAATGRVGNNEDGEQQIQAQQDGLINNDIAFSVNAALLPPASAAPPALHHLLLSPRFAQHKNPLYKN
jgi:hypothetical protein